MFCTWIFCLFVCWFLAQGVHSTDHTSSQTVWDVKLTKHDSAFLFIYRFVNCLFDTGKPTSLVYLFIVLWTVSLMLGSDQSGSLKEWRKQTRNYLWCRLFRIRHRMSSNLRVIKRGEKLQSRNLCHQSVVCGKGGGGGGEGLLEDWKDGGCVVK